MIRIVGLFILLALVGYNMVEIARLKAEVATLKRERTQHVPTKEVKTPGSGDGAGQIAAARRHSEQAEGYLRKGKYDEARREIALATRAAREASDAARTQSESALKQLRGAVDALSRSAGSLSDNAGKLWDNGKNSGGGISKGAGPVTNGKESRNHENKNHEK